METVTFITIGEDDYPPAAPPLRIHEGFLKLAGFVPDDLYNVGIYASAPAGSFTSFGPFVSIVGLDNVPVDRLPLYDPQSMGDAAGAMCLDIPTHLLDSLHWHTNDVIKVVSNGDKCIYLEKMIN